MGHIHVDPNRWIILFHGVTLRCVCLKGWQVDVRDVIPCCNGHRNGLQFDDLLSKTRVGSRNNNNWIQLVIYIYSTHYYNYTINIYRQIINNYSCLYLLVTCLCDCKSRQLALGRLVVVLWEMFSRSWLNFVHLVQLLVSHQDSHGHSKGHCWLNPILVSWHVRMFHSGLGRVRRDEGHPMRVQQ